MEAKEVALDRVLRYEFIRLEDKMVKLASERFCGHGGLFVDLKFTSVVELEWVRYCLTN